MKRLIISSALLTLALLIFITPPSTAGEKYHLILVPNPTPETILTMAELGLPLDDSHTIKGRGLEIPLNESEIALLDEQGILYNIVQEDLEKYYGDICRRNLENIPAPRDDDPVHMKYGSMGGFYTFDQMVLDLDSMLILYPDLCTQKVSIGLGWDENHIWMVKISDNPGIDEDEPEGIFDGCHHAREPGAMAAIMYAMWYLLENYGTDPEATYLIDNRELYFVPIVNPDGYIYNEQTNPNGGGLWRKNRRDNGGGVFGVDLNRNYPYMWGYDNQGSSPNPSSSTYRGPSAGSEPETQAMMNFIGEHDFHTGMTIHTYGDTYLCAYGYANVPPEHYDVHMDYMSYAAQENGYSYGYCYSIMYASNGRTQDWQLHEHDIINVEPEIGNHGFWPAINYIMPESAENLNCHLNQFWCAGGQVLFSSLEVEDGFLTPGGTENLIVTVFNRGWGTSEPVEFEISTSDTNVTLLNNTSTTDSLERRTSADNSANPFVLEVDACCPIGHEVEFTVAVDQNGFVRTEEVCLYVGEPEIFFTDDAESGMGNWSVSNGWGLCSSNPHGGTYSFADSPTGSYTNNTTRIMTMAQPVNLTSATSVWLEFWTRWDIESNYDFAQVEVSTNGITWIPVAGNYTVSGSGIGVQPYGQPGYEGSQPSWVSERMDLTGAAGQSYFKIRFELKSDGGVVGDGWFVDDIRLMGFTEPITPPDVTITLEPINPPIVIPTGGGSFDFTLTIQNNETSPVVLDGWTDILLPNGSIFGPVILRTGLNLEAGGSIIRTLSQNVPAHAPTGDYEYRAHLGLYPATVYVEDSFPFTKEP